jgi:CheY-like chemotaxis protein
MTPGDEPSHALRILIVDDDAVTAEMFGEILQLKGYETRLAHDGAQGLSVAREFVPDAIFLDLELPGMDGFEVARALREEPRASTCTLIALTGWDGPEHKRKAREAGFHFHLVKPLMKTKLAPVLASLTAKR